MSYYFGVNQTSVSMLFSSLSGNRVDASSALSSVISDYGSIRNGSYKKLLTAYNKKYNITNNLNYSNEISKKTNAISVDTTKTLAKVQSLSEDLKDSAQALLSKKSDSVFTKVQTKDDNGNTVIDYDKNAIYNNIKSFVDDYNDLISSKDDVKSSSILKDITHMIGTTKANEKVLSQIGINVDSNQKLSIDDDTFKKVDVSKIKSLFHSTGSYGYTIASEASKINQSVLTQTNKSNTYQQDGNYSSTYSSGNLYDSLF